MVSRVHDFRYHFKVYQSLILWNQAKIVKWKTKGLNKKKRREWKKNDTTKKKCELKNNLEIIQCS
jgi:hypothetical protein